MPDGAENSSFSLESVREAFLLESVFISPPTALVPPRGSGSCRPQGRSPAGALPGRPHAPSRPPGPPPASPRPSSLTHPCGQPEKGAGPPLQPPTRPVPRRGAVRGGGGRAVPSPTWRPPPPEGCPQLRWLPPSAPCAPGERGLEARRRWRAC